MKVLLLGTVTAYKERVADRLIGELLTELPALLIVGPRATGKTTTASRHASTTVRLDRPGEAVAFQADPDSALRGLKEPVLLDEYPVTVTPLSRHDRAARRLAPPPARVTSPPAMYRQRPGRGIATGEAAASSR